MQVVEEPPDTELKQSMTCFAQAYYLLYSHKGVTEYRVLYLSP